MGSKKRTNKHKKQQKNGQDPKPNTQASRVQPAINPVTAALFDYPTPAPPPPSFMKQFQRPLSRTVIALTSLVEDIVSENDKSLRRVPLEDQMFTKFHSAENQGLSLREHVNLMFQFMKCSDSCFVIGAIYIDRLTRRHKMLPIVSSRSINNILLSAVALAAKLLDDTHNNNAFYAEIGGLSVGQMNEFEVELIYLLDFDLWVWQQQYIKCVEVLDRQ